MNVSGTIGTKHTTATYDGAFKLSQKNKVLLEELDFICFQRTGVSLKTVDVVWVHDHQYYEHTIDKKDIDNIVACLQDKIDIFDIGSDPGNWSRWKKKAIEEKWQKNDWINFVSSISVETQSDEDDQNDSEWDPGSSEDESSEDEADDEDEADEADDDEDEESSEEEEIELAEDSHDEPSDDESEAEEVDEVDEVDNPTKRRKLNDQ